MALPADAEYVVSSAVTDHLKKLMAFHEADPDDDVAAYAIAREHLKADNREDARRWIEMTLQIQPGPRLCPFPTSPNVP